VLQRQLSGENAFLAALLHRLPQDMLRPGYDYWCARDHPTSAPRAGGSSPRRRFPRQTSRPTPYRTVHPHVGATPRTREQLLRSDAAQTGHQRGHKGLNLAADAHVLDLALGAYYEANDTGGWTPTPQPCSSPVSIAKATHPGAWMSPTRLFVGGVDQLGRDAYPDRVAGGTRECR
jgi:hypothetical protein